MKKTISEYRAYLVYFGCTSGWPKGKTEGFTFFTENAAMRQRRRVNITAAANLETEVSSISPSSTD